MLDWLPENISTFGEGIDYLFYLIYYITVAIFVLVYAVYITFVIRYRRRKKSARAYHYHGNNLLEFTWTALPFVLFAFLALYSDIIWREVKYESHKPNPDMEIEVMGQTFMWHFRYPGSDGIFGRKDQMLISTTNPFGLDPSRLVMGNKSLIGVSLYEPHVLGAALAFIRRKAKKLPFGELLGRKFPLEDINQAFDLAMRRKVARASIVL